MTQATLPAIHTMATLASQDILIYGTRCIDRTTKCLFQRAKVLS